ncbi:MAG: transcriptional repressor [Bacteroidaceae bacterium]|nr:transcriptional repressor [Bacteroidaceae bacterium]
MDNSKTIETVNNIFTEYLKENRYRRTPERYAILNAIYSINGNFEICDLLQMLEKEKFRVSRATVYNTITLLINANLVIHHQFGSTSKYERCYGSEKGHMICTKCGKVTEINNINIKETITANIKKFHLTHYSLYLYGICNKCHQAMKRRKTRMNKNKGQ